MPSNPHARSGLLNLVQHERIAANQRLEVTLALRRRDEAGFAGHLAQIKQGSAAHLTRAEFEKLYGADPQDLASVEAFAKSAGLTIVEQSAARRMVALSGQASQFEQAFGTELFHYAHDNGTFRGTGTPAAVPAALQPQVIAVLGLDNRPRARAHFRVAPRVDVSYSPLQVAERYKFPAGDGSGQCIGIIELGGGYKPADLRTYFQGLGLTAPSVVAVSVDGGTNQPSGSADGPDGEVMLDIEVAGAIAPAAKIAVYFSPNTDAGFTDAITQAVHDTTQNPSVISISWGGPESSWTSASMKAMDAAIADAIALGITVCVASGDSGASDGVTDGANHVDFPASSPHSLACGGTSLSAQGETVWNDGAEGGASGGGVSTVFAVPSDQSGCRATPIDQGSTPLKMRGVPDVAGDADPATGYQVRVDGTDTVIGGTSAVAPLWAGLIARLSANAGGSLGFLPPRLYATANACNDITKGNNNGYQAGTGWDACTGLGSPNGTVLAALSPVSLKKPSR